VFLGPLIPELTNTPANLEALFRALQGLDLDEIYVDKLNPRWGVLEALKGGLSRREECKCNLRQLLYTAANPVKYSSYSRQLKETATELARQTNPATKLTFCF
jgi:hypothetical protein